MSTRTAIVTGGLTGIGLASALALKAAGFNVAVGSRRGLEDTPAAMAASKALGKEAWIGQLDVTFEKSVDAFFSGTVDRFGEPTILVNSHGIFHESSMHDHSDNAWFEQIDINLNGVFRMIRKIFPIMIKQNHGRIVNISSTAGNVGAAKYSAYCASKAGVTGLSRAVAIEGAPHNITCVSISPTFIDTPMMDNAVGRMADATGHSTKIMREKLKDSNPQGRLVQPEEIGNLVAFCCSDASPALTNEDIEVNAGAMW